MNKRAHLMHQHPDITLNWEKKNPPTLDTKLDEATS